MLNRFKPFPKTAAWLFGSLWAVAVLFVVFRVFMPG